ncbi:hypothetical protein TCSYLVIO_007452 [Trypanosoma cruzi]|uniref:Uncharacterized protein n=2 Tax=Trypanosoma cruzi TaxID=5693 RepID=V5BH32_TRYCR|nr:hypothetical protein TCSYLVIO_007452 [Trypanosoma cruzi]ESS63793.1 hypothetical protein TCDM_08268 [Trypanosoma cruzi Dm28c]PBJ67834.1 hypothetical protein BCY84_22806 [Trypanosoma cruzi cruzi]KAF8287865.1 hypothetical protein TcBrA4_0017740 [Trypanosoma cruzi]PWU83222.1 hypothetical protein C4B63_355g20 [Trypanosoma cruzi]
MPMREDYPRYPRDVREKQIVSRPARERRLAELHLTAFPNVLNESAMAAPDTEHPQKEKKKGKKNDEMNAAKVVMEERAVAPMTTNQLLARMVEMAWEEKHKNAASGEKQSLTAPDGRFRPHNVSFDRSSTYRLDYCNKEVPGFHERVRVIPDYTKDWTETDKSNIENAKKLPYLTMPESLLKKRPTVYRHDYTPSAGRDDYRTLPYNTNLQDLSTSYAYSAYSPEDPARVIKYDKAVASCRSPRCVLWKTFSPRGSFMVKRHTESTAEELQRLRELRRLQLSKSSDSSTSSRKSPTEVSTLTKRTIVIPGMRGMGYRQAPKEGKDYIYLPRDHFCHQVVYDY